MFRQGIASGIAAFALIGATSMLNAAPISVSDNYVGADGGNHGDVVGYDSKFDISSMGIEQNGTQFEFTVNTNFAGKAGIYSQYTVGGVGIGYGDLFLASEWTPQGNAPYENDKASTGTDWTWGLVLSDRFNNNGGSVSLFQLPGNNAATTILSDQLMDNSTGAQWRYGQEVLVDTGPDATGSDAVKPFGNVGTWSLATSQLNISVNLGPTDILNGDSLAFHWGMTCANDVIECEIELTKKVPEPGTLGLIALALATLFFMRHRSKKARNLP